MVGQACYVPTMASLFSDEMSVPKVALLWGAAALIGGAYGLGYFSPAPPKGPLNARIDWKASAKPRVAKLDSAEKAWTQRSVEADRPPTPPVDAVEEAPAAPSPPADPRDGPGVAE